MMNIWWNMYIRRRIYFSFCFDNCKKKLITGKLENFSILAETLSGSLFVRDSLTHSLCPRHVERNYVPLFGVQMAWHNRTSTYVITQYVT